MPTTFGIFDHIVRIPGTATAPCLVPDRELFVCAGTPEMLASDVKPQLEAAWATT